MMNVISGVYDVGVVKRAIRTRNREELGAGDQSTACIGASCP